ncbi:MAG: polysaccharide biosynthesis/export family protein [Muribaculaceae bacterium]|nr:polysaccharide biosynthesis/export family protein [Muribaculaceae bacterium]
MKIKNLIPIAAMLIFLGSCQTPKLGYFQDVNTGAIEQMLAPRYITFQPGDKLFILVSSKNPELAYIFNLNIVSQYTPNTGALSTTRVANYTVDANGDINFPVLGTVHVAGMTRSEVATSIREKLVSQNLLRDATVTVDFMNLYFSVMGEVSQPGRFQIDRDRVTIIDALSRAGDLTIFGKRDNVLVMREENGKQMAYRVDLTNAAELYNSPAFYLKQDDIVYVEPNSTKANTSTVNGNNVRSTSFWFSLVSVLTSLSVLIFK